MTGINEAIVEDATLDIFRSLGYQTLHGPDIGPGGDDEERSGWDEVILTQRLNDAVAHINPDLPQDAVNAVVAQVLRAESQNTLAENLRVHQLITQGVPVEYRRPDGAIRHALAWLLDFDDPDNNEWMALNQFTIVEEGKNRRPDVVVFVNGLPLGIFELKNPGDENATLKGAFNQIQTYKSDIPALFTANEVCVVSDGLGASWARSPPASSTTRRGRPSRAGPSSPIGHPARGTHPRGVRAQAAFSTSSATSSCSQTNRGTRQAGGEVPPVLGCERSHRLDDRCVEAGW